MIRKLANAALGFALGAITAPLAAIVWPLFLAWFMYNESEGCEI